MLSELQQQQSVFNVQLFADMTNLVSTTASASRLQSREVADELTAKLAELEATSLQQSTRYMDSLEQSERLENSIKAGIDDLRRDFAGGLASQMSFLQDLSSNLQTSTNKDRADVLSDRLSQCIDRFFQMMQTHHGEFDKTSEEAQVITDDIVTVLQAILQEMAPTETALCGLKYQRSNDLDEHRETSVFAHEEGRSIKRMRGILESSQTVQVRASSASS